MQTLSKSHIWIDFFHHRQLISRTRQISKKKVPFSYPYRNPQASRDITKKRKKKKESAKNKHSSQKCYSRQWKKDNHNFCQKKGRNPQRSITIVAPPSIICPPGRQFWKMWGESLGLVITLCCLIAINGRMTAIRPLNSRAFYSADIIVGLNVSYFGVE